MAGWGSVAAVMMRIEALTSKRWLVVLFSWAERAGSFGGRNKFVREICIFGIRVWSRRTGLGQCCFRLKELGLWEKRTSESAFAERG
jgi:hypothetical protein